MTIMVNWVQLKMFSHQLLKFKRIAKSCCVKEEALDVVSFDLNAKNGMSSALLLVVEVKLVGPDQQLLRTP